MDKRIQLIADTYGYDAQSRQCIEEMAELTQAINKFWRKSLDGEVLTLTEQHKQHDTYTHLVEELADAHIMLEQMKYLLQCEPQLQQIAEQKIERQLQRIALCK